MEHFIQAIILGVVEGFTEFLPISSTGHLIIVNEFINFTGDFANMFSVVIQLGAILSVIVYFWDTLFPFGPRKSFTEKREVWNLWKKTVVGVLPAIILAGLFWSDVEDMLFSPVVVALALVVGGIVLIIVENRKKRSSINSITALSYETALTIGFIQCLAMIPGTSRSAATIIGAMLLGVSRGVAAEFSFFLAIPTMVAASAYSLLKTGFQLSSLQWQVLAVGFVVSFLVALAVIAAFMGYIRKKDFKLFAYYRIILGLIVLGFFYLRL